MSRLQRIVILVGCVGAFHSSLVPPVKQASGDLCRYHEFMERGWPFTREFGLGGVDGVALLTEYAILASLTAIICLVIGLLKGAGTKGD